MRKKNLLWGVVFSLLVSLFLPGHVGAASGTVYSCTINRCYAHPVTGVIEDAGGEAAFTTGQGMVEGTIYDIGILEETTDGQYYLTIRKSLEDYTTNLVFYVQNTGDSDWYSMDVATTATGSDNNGTTGDYRIQLPSPDAVIRGSMYVEPMGRDVVFYLYPSDYVEGNAYGMEQTIVNSAAPNEPEGADAGETGEIQQKKSADLPKPDPSVTQKQGAADAASNGEKNAPKAPAPSNASGPKSSITTEKRPDLTQSPGGITNVETDGRVRGLTLSGESEEEAATPEPAGGASPYGVIFATAAVVVVVLLVAAGIVYFMRKHWKRWGDA